MPREVVSPVGIEIASRRPASNALRLVFSFPVVLSSMLVLLALLTVRGRFNDPDMWWHLKVGEVVWNTHAIPRADTFSFTVAGHPWIAQEWLSQLSIYGAYHFGGYSGLMLWLCVLTSLLLIAAYALCALYSGNAKVAFLGGIVAWLFSTVGLAIRPHLIGYLLLALELFILHLGRTRNARWFFALPPLFAAWINFHSSFLFGLIVLATVLVCSLIELRFGLLISHRWPQTDRLHFTVAFALSLAALFVNPVGPKLLVYPLEVMLNQPVNLNAVSEWQQVNFGDGRALSLLAVASLILLVPLLRRIELHLEELLLVSMTFWFALRHERMFFLFGIVAGPVLCRLLADTWDRYELARDRFVLNAILIGLVVPGLAMAFPNAQDLQKQVEEGNPVKALAFIRHSGLSGRMLNEYIFGGYLIWAAPERKVFIDGRADLYDPASVLAQYGRWMMLDEDPTVLLDKYHIDFCLLSSGNHMVRVVRMLPGWRIVYSDPSAVVMAKR